MISVHAKLERGSDGGNLPARRVDEVALREVSGGVFGVAFVLEHVSPQSLHGVGIKFFITADDGDVFDHRLSDDQPIEWIAVM